MIMSHVPLTHKSSFVPRRLQNRGEESGPFRNRPLIIHDPMMMHVLTGQDTGATR